MTPEQAAALRAPFPAESIGKLPKVNCKGCVDANKRGGTCERGHQKAKCRICNSWISTQHIHLDFVGHAETTDRFLQVDPEWTWEPLAFAPNGLPQLDENGGLWIRLTIAGVPRLGYGAADGKRGPDAIKETIGDALRNAGMRFGVALDLWGAKFKGDDDPDGGEVHGQGAEPDQWESAQPARQSQAAQPSREQLLSAGDKAINEATSVETLKALANKVDGYALNESITTDDATAMHLAINKRIAELPPKAEGDQAPADQPKADGPPIQDNQRGKMQALFRELNMTDRPKQMELIRRVVGRDVASRNELTAAEAYNVIGALESQVRMGGGRKDRHLTAVNGAAAS